MQQHRHTSFYVKDISPLILCGKTLGYYINVNGAFELPFEIEPTKGEHDYRTCENCQKRLESLTIRFSEKFIGNGQKQGFPFCCTYHSNLTKLKDFDRVMYANVPKMAANKIIFTHQHIINNQNSENWYKVITDYIEWTVESFGQMPNDCGEPLYLSDYFIQVTYSLERDEEIKPEKKKRLLEFINLYTKPRINNSKTDLNVLINAYENWLKIFPFELSSYFGNLKEDFETKLPIFKGKAEVNIYSNNPVVIAHSKSSFFEHLLNLTNNLLTKMSGVALYEKGLITDVNKIKLELVINARKLKLKRGYTNGSQNEETQYRNMIKDWFADEKKFMDEITPLFQPAQPQQNNENENKSSETENDIRLSKINKHLEVFKDNVSKVDYKTLEQTFLKCFEDETYPTLNKKIQIRGKINKKRLGWALNRLLDYGNMKINLEAMVFAQNISVFENETFDKNDFTKSNLYKYLTTKTK